MNKPNPNKNRRVLVVDDNPAIHNDFRKILSPSEDGGSALDAAEEALFGSKPDHERQIPFEISSAYQGHEAVTAVQKALEEGRPYAMAFVDVRMPPGFDGVETTQRIWAIDAEIQIVICTAYSDYSWDEMFETIGQDDRMVILKKPFDTVEALQLAHALTEKWWLSLQSKQKIEDLEKMVAERTQGLRQANHDLQIEIEERKRTEIMLRESEDRFSSAFEHAPIGEALVLPTGRFFKVNQALCKMLGYTEAELLTRTFHDITHPENLPAAVENSNRILAGEIASYHTEKRYIHALGHPVTVLLDLSLVRNDQGQPIHFIAQVQDITEKKRLEAQLFQSQKMETVGSLAGGIAHEFNSIMSAIIGQSEMLLGDLPPQNPLAQNAAEIRQSANRAARLTAQLLAYGRKQILQPRALDLNEIISNLESLLRPLIGENVEIRLLPFANLQPIHADAGQIEQVLMNMAMNARDAMPQGGRLTLETANITFDGKHPPPDPEIKPGDYVMLAISDTGSGMSAEVKQRAFEPFFSTKGVGQGTGLGLATCYGIIKQSGGHISVYSEQGQGTTFKIYLPRMRPKEGSRPEPSTLSDLPRGSETILLVEDDATLRTMAATFLARLGYAVLPAANGMEALDLIRDRRENDIDLLFADMLMPRISEGDFPHRVLALHPKIKILFTSTYPESEIVRYGELKAGVALLQKPFAPVAMARKVREVLDGLA